VTDMGWISLTFDDALDQHLDVALPIMNARALRGTFYVPLSAPAFIHRQTEWKAVAGQGHELGNHTVFHPALASKAWVRPGNSIDFYSLDRMRMELEYANELLSAFDGQNERTFAYPCSNPYVGHGGWCRAALQTVGFDRTRLAGWIDQYRLDLGATRQSYVPTVRDLFVAGRGGGLNRSDVIPPVSTWDRAQLLSKAVEDWSLDELKSQVEDAIRRDTWCILQFHGVGGGHRMNCDPAVFAEFTAWLSEEHRERVTTVLEAAKRLWPKPLSSESNRMWAMP
jgi:hypothetical protein